jgi:predicted DNA-binding protein (MmcQ/YjbR family)
MSELMKSALKPGVLLMEHEQDKSNQSTQWVEMLDNVRHICEPFPEVEEVIDGFGHTTFKVKGKSFIILGETEDSTSLSFKSDKENQEFLLLQGGYYKTPYIGQHGWVSIKAPQDWDELGILLKEAYLRAAPKRLVKQVLEAQ